MSKIHPQPISSTFARAFWDLETTGLDQASCRVVSISCKLDVCQDMFNEFDKDHVSFESLCRPDVAIPAEATAIHKITNEMVLDQPDTKTVLLRFLDFVKAVSTRVKRRMLLIAHNGRNYDQWVLQFEWQRHVGTDFYDAWADYVSFGDTFWTLASRWPERFTAAKSLTLQSLYRHYVKPGWDQDHSSSGDTEALMSVVYCYSDSVALLSGLAIDAQPPHPTEHLLTFNPRIHCHMPREYMRLKTAFKQSSGKSHQLKWPKSKPAVAGRLEEGKSE